MHTRADPQLQFNRDCKVLDGFKSKFPVGQAREPILTHSSTPSGASCLLIRMVSSEWGRLVGINWSKSNYAYKICSLQQLTSQQYHNMYNLSNYDIN